MSHLRQIDGLLYEPRREHDACGIGAVVSIDGARSHQILELGNRILLNLQHRGAAGSDEITGDGAGILFHIPHKFFAAEAGRLGTILGQQDTYGVGMVFAPKDQPLREKCEEILNTAGVQVSQLHGCEVQWDQSGDRWEMKEIPGTEFSMNVDLVLLAMGFTHVVHSGLIDKFGLKLDSNGNLDTDSDFQTSQPGIFAVGDSVSGASLIVHAIAAGRKVAASIDARLS